MIINCIAIPRTISTSLMYAFHQHSEIASIDEPFYAYYLKETGLEHPGRNEVLNEMPTRYEEVRHSVLEKSKHTKHLYVKNMAHHVLELDIDFLKRTTVFFLFRHPARVIQSMQKVYPNLDARDVGIKRQWEILEACHAHNIDYIAVESPWILENPAKNLRKVVEALELNFEESMLSWEAGPKSIDGSWAKYWYANTHSSTGFSKQISEKELPKLKGPYKELMYECLPYFENLQSKAIA